MAFSPNQISAVAFFMAVLGGVSLFFSSNWLIFTAFLWGVSIFLDGVDGYIARKKHQASKFGDILDHILDRFSDIFIFLSITYSPYMAHKDFGLLAIVSIFLVSFLGQLGITVGIEREFSSPANRVFRMVVLAISPLIEFFLSGSNIKYLYLNFTFFDLLMLLFILLAGISTIIRISKILNRIK